MNIIDIRTLLLVITLMMVCRAAILIYVWGVEKQYAPIRFWALGSASIAMGSLLIGLRDLAPPVLSILVAQAFVVFGWMVVSGGSVLATRHTPPWRIGVALSMATVAGVAWYLFVTPSYGARTVVVTLPTVLFDGYAAWTCLFKEGGKRNTTLKLLGGLLLVQAGANVWKLVVTLADNITSLHTGGAATAPFYMVILASIVIGTVLFVLLAAEELQEKLDREIQERAARENTLRLAALVFENSSESMMITDPDGVILNVNPAFTALTGYTAEEAIGQTPRLLKSGRQGSAFYVEMWQRLLSTGSWQGDLWNRHKDGGLYAERLTINSILRADGTAERRVALFHDITAQKRSEEVIYHQAHFDALTGLPNRYCFFDQLSKELSRARRSGARVGLLFMDLNKFKPVNDQHGHDAGDHVLKTVSQRWQEAIRSSDTLARLGGDEFALIVDGLMDASELATIAHKLMAALTHPIDLPRGAVCTVGTSIGGSIYPDSASEMDSLVAAADAAMYVCKEAGGGIYQLSPAVASPTQAESDWVVFDASHLIGISVIDDQHRKLVHMVNEVNRAIKASGAEQDIQQHLLALIAYARLHFDTEHGLMVEHGYPGLAAHDRQHGELLAQAEQLVARLMPGDELILLQTLKDWLMGHIMNSDKPMGAYLVSHGLN